MTSRLQSLTPPTNSPPRQTLRAAEVAAILGVPRLTVYRMVRRGVLPVVHTGLRQTLIPRGAVERLLGYPVIAQPTGEAE